MKGAEFYEGGRIQVDIWEKERERRRWKRGSRKVWVEFGGGGAKYEKGQNEKKRGPTRLNRPTLEKLAATCQPPPWPYVPYFSPLFNPGTIFQPGLERKRKGNRGVERKSHGSAFSIVDEDGNFFYFNWSKNFAFKSWRIMETFIFLREIFFFSEKTPIFQFDSAT